MSDIRGAEMQQDRNTSGGKELVVLVLKAVVGTVMVCVGFANIYNLVDWSQEYNQVAVYFGFFLWMSVAGMLFWAGVKGLWGKITEASQLSQLSDP